MSVVISDSGEFVAFFIFLLTSSCIALIPRKNIAFNAVVLMVCIFPTSNAYSQAISLQGLYFYDAFTVTYFVRLIFEAALGRGLKLSLNRYVSVTLIVHAVLLVIILPSASVDKYYFKDMRPALNILFFVAVYDLYAKAACFFDERQVRNFAVVAGGASFLKLWLIVSGYYGYQDEYYEANSFRYLDASAYVCSIYLIYVLGGKYKVGLSSILSMILPAASVLLTNSRFILLSLGFAILASNFRDFRRGGYAVFVLGLLGAVFIYISREMGVARVADNLDLDSIVMQLSIRFGPALERISEFSAHNYIFGLGAGTFFNIPWFEYRGLETEHSNIDSAYFTYFVKYGVLGVFLLYGFVVAAISKSPYVMPIRLFILCMFIVSATPYQPYCIGLIFSALVVRRN